MPVRRTLATALLLAAVAMPRLLGWGAHALAHGEHAGHEADWPDHAEALPHGHEHDEGEPDHEHHLLPSPPLKQEEPREDLQSPVIGSSLTAAAAEHLPPAGAVRGYGRISLSGSGPPLLHLLCTLLI